MTVFKKIIEKYPEIVGQYASILQENIDNLRFDAQGSLHDKGIFSGGLIFGLTGTGQPNINSLAVKIGEREGRVQMNIAGQFTSNGKVYTGVLPVAYSNPVQTLGNKLAKTANASGHFSERITADKEFLLGRTGLESRGWTGRHNPQKPWLQSFWELATIKYAEQLSGRVVAILGDAPAGTTPEGYRNSVFYRVDLPVMLGMNVTVGTKVFTPRGGSVTTINGVSIGALKAGSLDEAFKAIEAVSRAQLGFVAGAARGATDETLRQALIEAGFSKLVEAIGEIAEAAYQHNLTLISSLPADPLRLRKQIQADACADLGRRLDEAFSEHLAALCKAGIPVDPDFVDQLLAG